MGLVGFLLGALLTLILRGLQGLTPVWDVGPGMVLAAFMSAGFFIWGMGGFDPRMSAHGEGHEEEHTPAEEPKPIALLSSTLWQLTTLLIVGLLVIAAVAWVPFGPALTITADPVASTTGIGFFDVNLFGIEIPQVSELVVFIAFIAIMMLSLLVVAGLLGRAFFGLAQGVATAQATPVSVMERQLFELPPGEAAAPAGQKGLPEALSITLFISAAIAIGLITYNVIMPIIATNVLGDGDILVLAEDAKFWLSVAAGLGLAAAIVRPRGNLMALAVYGAIAAALYPIFYHVAVGLVYLAFPSIGPITAEVQRQAASILNALLIPLLILRPKWITRFIGRVARELAKFLRWVGTVK
jgi:hypothetical protein